MAITRETIVYQGPGGPFEGVIAADDEVEAARPGVMIVPNVLGAKEADFAFAERVAALGHVAFVADVFGQGNRAVRGEEGASRFMDALNADRALLRDRLAASLQVLAGDARVDPARQAAMGFCFGGKCVLDMARAGLPVLGGVSLHGVYDRPDYASIQPIAAKLLVCHGWDDPLGPPETVAALAAELTAAQADWQVHGYGHAGHGFTDRSLEGQAMRPGFGYNAAADRRSWQAAKDFLAELFT